MSDYSIFTSESVSEGHPDKMADQISDAILDAILKDDVDARVAVETLVKTGMVVIAGEVTTNTYVDLEEVVRGVVTDIGYTSSKVGFDGANVGILVEPIREDVEVVAVGFDDIALVDALDLNVGLGVSAVGLHRKGCDACCSRVIRRIA